METRDTGTQHKLRMPPELKEKLLSGMFAEAKIIIATKKGFSVPNDAVIKSDDKSFVLLLVDEANNNYSFKKTLVQVGEVSEFFTEIISDKNVHQESKVLVKGVFELTD